MIIYTSALQIKFFINYIFSLSYIKTNYNIFNTK